MIKRDTIYHAEKKIPVWFFDKKEFFEPKPLQHLRHAERYALMTQGVILYFDIDETNLDASGFPEVTLEVASYALPDDENPTKFRRTTLTKITTETQLRAILERIRVRLTAYREKLMPEKDFAPEHLYQYDEGNGQWTMWRRSVSCNELIEGITPTPQPHGKRFFVHPDSDQTKCRACIDAQILKLWKEVTPCMTVDRFEIVGRTLHVEMSFQFPTFTAMDSRNAGQLLRHIATIDQMKLIFGLSEAQYQNLRHKYENQLNKVHVRYINEIKRGTAFEIKLDTLLREKRNNVHAGAP